MGLRHTRLSKRQSTGTSGIRLWSMPRIGAAAAMCGALAPAVVLGSSTLMLMSAASAQTSASDADKLVSLDVTGADLAVVVSALRAQAGVQIVVREDPAQPFGKVNIMMKRAPLSSVLKYIALSANASLTKDDSGVYILQPLSSAPAVDPSALLTSTDSQQNASNDAQQSATNDVPAQSTAPHYGADLHWRKIVLKYQVPNDVLKLLHREQDVVNVGPDMSRMDTSPQGTPLGAPLQILTMNAQQASVPVGPNGAQGTAPNYAPDGSPGQEAHQFFPGGGGGGRGGFGGGRFGGGGGQFGGGQGGFGGNQAGGGINGQQQPDLLPDGVDRLIALQADNSILVLATPEGYSELRKLISQIDVRAKQVEIKVQFVTAAVQDLDALSLNFSLLPMPGLGISSNLATGTPQTISLQYAAGNAALTLLAGLSRTHSKTVQAPLVTTTNNTQASIQINQIVYYNTSTTVVAGGGTAVTNNNVNQLRLTTGLFVTPRINGDDSVTLQLFPQVTTLSGTAQNGQPPPSITESVSTLRTVKNNETMVLGGLVTKNDVRGSDGIPFLSQLPLIGSLFRTKNINQSDTELLIFVTPHVLEDDDNVDGAVAAGTGPVTPN